MLSILASNNSKITTNTKCLIRTEFSRKKSLVIAIGFFNQPKVDIDALNVELLDQEKSKSFLGTAGLGLVGGALLGPIGLIAGVLAGGNTNDSVFGLSFKLNEEEIKLVVRTTDKSDIKILKERCVLTKVS